VPESIPGYPFIHHAHNFWLYLASETGIPLTIGFCWVIGRFYYGGIKSFMRQPLSTPHQAILLSYLLAFSSCLLFGLFDVAIFDSRINVLNWVMLAGVSLLANANSERPNEVL
jgi:O-antigen ligase